MSLLSALMGAQQGQLQLAVAARLARGHTDSASSAEKLIAAAQQNFNSLANAAAGIGTQLDIRA